MQTKSKRNLSRILLLLAGIIWGLAFVGNKMVLNAGWTDTQLMFVRFFFAMILVFLFYFKRLIKAAPKAIVSGLVLGFFFYLGFYFQTIGLMMTTASNNALVTAAYIVLVPVVAFVVERKKMDWFSLVAAVVVMIGISFISVDFKNLTISIGDLFTLLGSVFFAIQIYLLAHETHKYDVIVLVGYQIVAFTVLYGAMMFIKDGLPDLTQTTPSGISLVLLCFLLGLFASVIGLFLQLVGQKYTNASEAGILMSTESVFAPIFAILILKESFTVQLFFGMVLVFIGIIISETKLSFFIKNKKVLEEVESCETKLVEF